MFLLLLFIVLLGIKLLALSFHFSNLVIDPKTLDDIHVLNDYTQKGLIDLTSFQSLQKEEIWLESPYGYLMRGWFFPYHGATKTVILCHGITMNLYGSMKYFHIFYRRGFNVLVYDHRSHGKSGGKYTTLGYYEKYDLKAWVDWIRNRTGPHSIVGIHGESMGAAIALQYAAMDHRIAFSIADCSFSDLYELLHFRLWEEYKLPPFPILHGANLITYLRTKAFFQDISPIRTIKEIAAPVLFIHGLEDRYIPPEMSIKMYQHKEGIKDIFLVENARHAKSFMESPEAYEKKIDLFLKSIEVI